MKPSKSKKHEFVFYSLHNQHWNWIFKSHWTAKQSRFFISSYVVASPYFQTVARTPTSSHLGVWLLTDPEEQNLGWVAADLLKQRFSKCYLNFALNRRALLSQKFNLALITMVDHIFNVCSCDVLFLSSPFPETLNEILKLIPTTQEEHQLWILPKYCGRGVHSGTGRELSVLELDSKTWGKVKKKILQTQSPNPSP
jgi:hypothetical protein